MNKFFPLVTEQCEKLTPINVDLKCFRKGSHISCDENSTLLVGTKVLPTCKMLHKYGDPTSNYSEITCQDDGKWDKPLFSCYPRKYSELNFVRYWNDGNQKFSKNFQLSKSHLRLLQNVHTKFQLPGSIWRRVIRGTNSKNYKKRPKNHVETSKRLI